MAVRLGDIFSFEGGNSGLTSEFIYKNQAFQEEYEVPVLSGATIKANLLGHIFREAKPDNKDLKIFTGPCLLVVRKGVAGSIKYIKDIEFTTNDDAYVLLLNEEYKDKLDLKWFLYEYQELFYNLVTSKSDNGTFNKQYAENQEITLPPHDNQLKNRILKDKIKYISELIECYVNSIETLKKTRLNISGEKTHIKNVFNFKGGNSGLTEEFIYNNQPKTLDDSVPIYSSATLQANLMGYVSRNSTPNGKRLKIFEGPCILIARNGYAGKMTFIEKGWFTTNDHAYVLVPRRDIRNKINLRWFMSQYQELFYNLVTSKSDNATFNKQYAEIHLIKLPDIKVQNGIASELLKIDSIIKNLENSKENLEELVCYKLT